METTNNKEEFNNTITSCNKVSFFYVIKILCVATILLAIFFSYHGFYFLNVFFIILLFIFFYYYKHEPIIDKINFNDIKNFFLVFFILMLLFAYCLIPWIYNNGLNFEFIKLVFHNALITPSLILNSQIFDIKTTKVYLKIYVSHSFLLIFQIYFFFPVGCFEKEIFLEIILGILVVLFTCSNIDKKSHIRRIQ